MNKPIIINNNISIFFDIDSTLIFDPRSFQLDKSILQTFKTVKIKEAYSDKEIEVIVHEEHITLLKNHVNRGFKVILWSNNGVEHTENVMKALELEEFIFAIMSKPTKLCDDLQPNEFLPKPIYIKETSWINFLQNLK